MDSSRSQSDDWLVEPPEGGAKPEPRRPDPAEGQRLAAIERRLDAIESSHGLDRVADELKIEIRGWITAELNAIADRLEAAPRPAAAPPPPPSISAREREILGQTGFLPYADRVEQQLSEIEQRVERAGQIVRDLSSTGDSPASRPGSSAQGSGGVDQISPEPQSGQPSNPVSRAVAALNSLTFEQLREAGLSVTQSARLLARRDARGSFASFDDLNDLVGFSREVLDQLRKRLSLG